MNNEADHDVPLPNFRTIAQRHAQVSEAHASLSHEMELLHNVLTIEQGATILQQLTEINNNVNHRFTTIENRLTEMEGRINNRFTEMENRFNTMENRVTMDNRLTAMETRSTARFTALNDNLTSIENKINIK